MSSVNSAVTTATTPTPSPRRAPSRPTHSQQPCSSISRSPAILMRGQSISLARRAAATAKKRREEARAELERQGVHQDGMDDVLEGLVGRSASTRANVSQNKGKRLKRVRWTPQEVIALRTGVNKYGEGRWAVILREFASQFHPCRISVDLKDKWRNLFKSHKTVLLAEAERQRTQKSRSQSHEQNDQQQPTQDIPTSQPRRDVLINAPLPPAKPAHTILPTKDELVINQDANKRKNVTQPSTQHFPQQELPHDHVPPHDHHDHHDHTHDHHDVHLVHNHSAQHDSQDSHDQEHEADQYVNFEDTGTQVAERDQEHHHHHYHHHHDLTANEEYAATMAAARGVDHEAAFGEQVVHAEAAHVEHAKHVDHNHDVPHDGHVHDDDHIHHEHHIHDTEHEHEHDDSHDEHSPHHQNVGHGHAHDPDKHHGEHDTSVPHEHDAATAQHIDDTHQTQNAQPEGQSQVGEPQTHLETVNAEAEQAAEEENAYDEQHDHRQHVDHEHGQQGDMQVSAHADARQYHCPNHDPGARHEHFEHAEPRQTADSEQSAGQVDHDEAGYEDHAGHDHHPGHDPDQTAEQNEVKTIAFADAERTEAELEPGGPEKLLGTRIDGERVDAHNSTRHEEATSLRHRLEDVESAQEGIGDHAQPTRDVQQSDIPTDPGHITSPEQLENSNERGQNEVRNEQLQEAALQGFSNNANVSLETEPGEAVGHVEAEPNDNLALDMDMSHADIGCERDRPGSQETGLAIDDSEGKCDGSLPAELESMNNMNAIDEPFKPADTLEGTFEGVSGLNDNSDKRGTKRQRIEIGSNENDDAVNEETKESSGNQNHQRFSTKKSRAVGAAKSETVAEDDPDSAQPPADP